MSSTTLQDKVKAQLAQSLLLNTQLLGTHAYADLQCLLGVSILQLKSLPTDFAESNHLLTFSGEILLPAPSSSSTQSTTVSLAVDFALFDDANDNRQAVLQLHQTIEDYLNQTDALIQLNPNDTEAAEDLFSLYAALSSSNTFGSKIIYSSLDATAITGTSYSDAFSTTIAQANFQAGLNFKIEVGILSTVQDYLADLFGGNNKSTSSYGVVKSKNSSLQAFLNATEQTNKPEPYLFINQDFDAALTFFSGHLELSLNQLSLGFPTKNKLAQAPEISFDASATLATHTLDLQVDFFLYQRMVAFNFKSFPTLKELLTTFCNPDSYFVAPFDVLLDIELASLELVFDPIEKELKAIQLEVTSTSSITLLDNLIAIQPQLSLDILNPTDESKRQLQGLFTATWEFGSTTFDSSLSYPVFDLSAEMAQGEQLDVNSVMTGIIGGVPLPEIDITALSVNGNYTQKSFNFRLDINSNWVIPLLGGNSLEIEQVQLGVSSNNDQRDYQMAGVIQLDSLPISVSADFDGKDWQLNGSAFPNTPIYLRNILRSLLSSPGDAEVLNDIISKFPNFGINSLQFSYNGGDKTFSFGLGVVLTINSSGSSARTSYFFDLSIAKEQTSSGLSWVMKGKSEFKTPMKLSDLMTDVMSSFGFSSGLSMPSSISSLDLSITTISFSYHASSKTFEFDFDLSEGASISGVTGDISTSQSDPHTFSAFTLTVKVETKTIKLNIDSGVKISDLLHLGDDLPTSLQDITLSTLDFTFVLGGDNTQISFTSTYTDSNKNNFQFNGIFQENTSGSTTTKYFGGNIKGENGASIDIGNSFPIQVDIKDLFLAKLSTKTGTAASSTNTIFGSEVTVDGDFDLAKLPVVGEFLNDAKFSFNSLRITYAKDQISYSDLKKFNNFLHQINVAPLVTSQSSTSNNQPASASFDAGFSLQGTLVLGDNLFTIPLHTDYTPASKPTTGGSGSNTPAKSPTTPAPVAKKFGPVEIKSIGLGLSGGKVVFKFTGGLTLGPLTFEFIDLEVASSMSDFDPSLSLQGLGIDLKKPPLTLEGLFMEGTLDVPIPNYATGTSTIQSIKDYSGSISIAYKQYTLAALGSYAKLPDGANTFFVYGFLGAPLGGPPFFFVTGAAAGFGYNRAFTLPTVDGISTYPLIEPVMPAAAGNPASFNFSAMNQKFMPSQGEYWGAVGIKGESFKMVNSFVLLDVQFGKQLEIDIIGLSNMQFPKPKEDDVTPPLAKITVGLVARIIPERGIVTINGAFQPGSYVYNPLAKISGGFALLTVFKTQNSGPWNGAQAGDFVFTIGGYASNFQTPSYYPTAARLQLLWQVSSLLSVKAQAYFAITPKALMAGGSLAINFNAGGAFAIHVAFNMGADFIIFWKPYHYQAAIYVSLAVTASINIDLWLFSIHACIHFDLSANLNIWGPSFSGHAAVHVHVIVSFTVGINFGDAPQIVNPIDWTEFSTTLLPDADKIITTKITNGIVASQSTPTKSEPTVSTPVVNAKEVALLIQTAIPIKSVTGISPKTPIAITNSTFGIKPMANTVGNFSKSALNITVNKDGVALSTTELNDWFSITPIYKNLPAAMWEAAETSGTVPNKAGTPSLITDLLCGLEITTVSPTKANPYPFPSTHYDNINTPAATAEPEFSYTTAGFNRTTTS